LVKIKTVVLRYFFPLFIKKTNIFMFFLKK
jgi:hypothetical protein